MNGYSGAMRKFLGAFLLAAPVLLAQLDSNSVTVTASRSASLQPDQVVFSLQVQSGMSTSLDDVVAALHGLGVTAANFTGINSAQFISGIQQPPPTLLWNFQFSAPLSKMKDTISQLTTLKQTLAQQNNGLLLAFNVAGTQVSQQLAQSQPCVIADLLADARAQAQKLASAAGFTLDVIQALSSVSSIQAAQGLSLLGASVVPPCTVTVKFAILRYQ